MLFRLAITLYDGPSQMYPNNVGKTITTITDQMA